MSDKEINTAIKEAIANATPGPWEYQRGHYGRNHLVSQIETGNVVCMGKTFEKTESDFTLIANAPTWLTHQQQLIDSQAKYIGFLQSAVRSGEKWEGIIDDFISLSEGRETP